LNKKKLMVLKFVISDYR